MKVDVPSQLPCMLGCGLQRAEPPTLLIPLSIRADFNLTPRSLVKQPAKLTPNQRIFACPRYGLRIDLSLLGLNGSKEHLSTPKSHCGSLEDDFTMAPSKLEHFIRFGTDAGELAIFHLAPCLRIFWHP